MTFDVVNVVFFIEFCEKEEKVAHRWLRDRHSYEGCENNSCWLTSLMISKRLASIIVYALLGVDNAKSQKSQP